MNISGTWTGEYRYDPEFGSQTVGFTMRLKQNLVGRLTGTVLDGPGGMPEEGRIVGWRWRRELRFRKLMPVVRIVAEGSTILLADHVAALGEFTLPPRTAHPPVVYEGRLSDDGLSASGTWSVGEHVIPLEDGIRSVRSRAYGGTWAARRSIGRD